MQQHSSLLLSIIIVSYNTQQLTLQTIASAQKEITTAPLLKDNSEIIVIDNKSSDGSGEALKKLSLNSPVPITLIANTENNGFGRANNQGIEISQGKYILFLNSDTIVQEGALTKMVQAFEDHFVDDTTSVLASQKGKLDRLGILSANLQNPDGTTQPQGGSFPNLLSLSTHMLMIDDIPVIGKLFPSTQHTGRNSRTQQTPASIPAATLLQQDWVSGAAMMVRRSLIQEIGPFDQNIFMYGEDVEFCMRAKDHHWDVAIHPQAHITHLGMASSSSINAIIGEYKGYLYIWAKHKPIWQMPLLKAILRTGAVLRALLFGTIMGKKEKARPYVTLQREVLR